jgi:poly-gamma-glutamate capsule biosynthesis protein CapA/YwtB (metallophosphatase superfamily)
VKDTSEKSARRIASEMHGFKCQGDMLVASIHWGGNWGYRIRDEEIRFAHQLIENGITVVHGHSSHQVKTAEIYRGRLVLYGCGDLLNDYEGIGGHETFRSNLTLMYLPVIDARRGRLVKARMIPMRVARFRLNRAAEADAKWLCDLLNQLGAPLGTRCELASDHTLMLHNQFANLKLPWYQSP